MKSNRTIKAEAKRLLEKWAEEKEAIQLEAKELLREWLKV